MMPPTRLPRFIQRDAADTDAERAAARCALLQPAAAVAPTFFYDRLGSHLFEAITELPEYYPTRTEAAIFAAHGAEMAACIGSGATLVDLGAGNCTKAARLFPLLEPRRYVAIDVSVEFLRDSLRQVQREHPAIEMIGLGLDFSTGFDCPPELLGERPVFLYPGSSIGNFTPAQALAFLRRLRERVPGGGLLIGIDLLKPAAILEPAYDDALGVTAAFNLNALRHLNRIIGSDFEAADWRHVAGFDAVEGCIRMHLEARRELLVRWPGGQRRFAAGERIHTENSCKYTLDGLTGMLRDAGFGEVVHYTDAAQRFAVLLAS